MARSVRSRFPTLGYAGSRQDRRNFCSILSSCFLTPDVCGEVPVAVTVRALSRVELRAKAKVSVKTRLFTVIAFHRLCLYGVFGAPMQTTPPLSSCTMTLPSRAMQAPS